MVADKIFNLQVSSQLVYQSDIPIKGKTFIKVFIDKTGEGTWETIDGSSYQIVNDSIVFSTAPTGFLLIMQVATTPTELQQTPTDISMLLTVREEIKELALHVGELVIATENLQYVTIVSNSIDIVSTVAGSIVDVQTVADSINEIINVEKKLSEIHVVVTNLAEILNVSDNMTKVTTVADSMTKVTTVSDNMTKVTTVSDNIVDINSVSDLIVPNLAEILLADTNAQTATNKASEASASAIDAQIAEDKAKKWADENEDVPVETDKFSAKHWAIKAEEIVTAGVIDDSAPSVVKTYSSTKVQNLHDLQAQEIANLATSQGEFIGTGLPVLTLTTVEQTLPLTVTIPSTNSNVFDFDDTNNRCTFKINASFNFRTVLELSLSTDATRTITVTGRNLIDNSVVYTRTATVNGTSGDIFQINSNQLLTIGRNGIPSAPLTVYFTFKADNTGVVLRALTSQLTSSNSYEEKLSKTGNETKEGVLTFNSPPIVDGKQVSTGQRKNYLINGNFDRWDYATSQTTSGYDSDNRWQNTHSGSSKVHSQILCTDAERELINALYFSRTVVTSVAGISNKVLKMQAIENITLLAGKTVTLSFWAKADSPKNIAIEFFQGFGTGGSPSAIVTGIGSQLIALTTVLTKYKITVAIPSITGKTLGTDGINTSLTGLIFWFDAGSSYNGRTAYLGQQSGTFDIAQVKLEDGSVATDGWHPYDGEFGSEVQANERYLPIFHAGASMVGQVLSPSTAYFVCSLITSARVAPIGFTLTGTVVCTNANGGAVTINTLIFSDSSIESVLLLCTGISGFVSGDATILVIRSGKIIFTGCEL